MPLVCYDSIYAANLPAGADAYLGYVDGHWPDYEQEVQKFTAAHVIGLTVFNVQQGDGCDIENGDLTPAQGANWCQGALARGVKSPILYASISAMSTVVSELSAVGIARSRVRLFSAHYGPNPHICGPSTCSYPGAPAVDATQFTNQARGLNGSAIDESWLSNTFFATSPSPGPAPIPHPVVPPDKRNVFTPVAEDGVFGFHTCAAQQFVDFNGNANACDGRFGILSKMKMQMYLGVVPDGVVGPITVRALQKRVGAAQDGVWGKETTTRLQAGLNAGTY